MMIPLKAILYIEFDNDEGPVIRYQAPAPSEFNFRHVFEKIKLLFITNRELCNRVITVNDAFGSKVIGYPLRLDHEKYNRNALSFNVALVFAENTDTRPYEPVLVKLATAIESLELESEFLSTAASRATFADRILPDVYHGLVAEGRCSVHVDAVTSINLKIFPVVCAPPPIKVYEVPVRVRNFRQLKADDETLRRIIPYINGVNYVKKIAYLADVDVAYVQACIRQLVFFNCVHMVDIFQFSNCYVPTPAIRNLYRTEHLRRECMQFVVVDAVLTKTTTMQMANGDTTRLSDSFKLTLSPEDNSGMPAMSSTASVNAGGGDATAAGVGGGGKAAVAVAAPIDMTLFRKIFKLYCSLERGERMSAICSKEPLFQHVVDPRRFVIFGVIHGLIRRVQRFPILEVSMSAAQDSTDQGPGVALKQHLDGVHSYDELCCEHGISYAALDGTLRNMPNCFIINK